MIPHWLERTELLIGEEKLEQLNKANVLVIGLGGVGSYAAEFLCRAGIGKMTIVDGDTVDPTNRNRQLPALNSTAGQSKAELMGTRLLDINPDLKLTVIREFLSPERTEQVVADGYDYVLDCIDSISPKITLIASCVQQKVRIISSMGAGGKTDPWHMHVADISKSYNCPFARTVRKRLKKFNIKSGVKVIFSSVGAIDSSLRLTDGSNFKKSFYGTISFIPPLFGLLMAAEVVNELAEIRTGKRLARRH